MIWRRAEKIGVFRLGPVLQREEIHFPVQALGFFARHFSRNRAFRTKTGSKTLWTC